MACLLDSVWGTAEDDVYAAGFRVRLDDDFNVTGTILHFDGTDWSDVDLPPSDVINQLWASSAEDVFAVGSGRSRPAFRRGGLDQDQPDDDRHARHLGTLGQRRVRRRRDGHASCAEPPERPPGSGKPDG